MKFRSLLGILLLLAVFSCKKDDDEKVVPPPDNFQPVAPYSSWTYAEFPGSNVFSVSVTPETDSIRGKKWHKLFSSQSGYYWFRKEAGNYYWLLHIPPDTLEYLYLKDNAETGATWEFTYPIGGTDTRYVYTITEKDQKRLVYGVIYDHTITVRQDIYRDLGAGSDTLMNTEYQTIANDVGPVLIDRGKDKIYLAHYQIKE